MPVLRMLKLPVLVSYAYLRDQTDEQVDKVLGRDDVEILLDCGAFTIANAGAGEISLSDYMAWLHKWKHRLFGYIALDRLGDPVTTERNLREMVDAGLKPWPVHVLGDDAKRMDQLFELSDVVACGGLRRPHRAPAPLSYVKAKMEWAGGRNVHWLGYTRAQSIATWRPFSVDCSNFTSGPRWGLFDVYMGGGVWRKIEPADKPGRSRSSPSEHDLPIRMNIMHRLTSWGFDTDKMLTAPLRGAESGGGPTPAVVAQRKSSAIGAFSYIEYAMDVREKFGTRVFLAASPDQALGIFMALDHVRAKRGAA